MARKQRNKFQSEDIFLYDIIPTVFGYAGMVWIRAGRSSLKVKRIFISPQWKRIVRIIKRFFPSARRSPINGRSPLMMYVRYIGNGAQKRVPVNYLDMRSFSTFEKKVLQCLSKIPPGMVTTYARVAQRIGQSRASRAVGNTLRKNPFPLVFPCHRVVRSDGTIGGFQGGAKLKAALLHREGVSFDKNGKRIGMGSIRK